MKNYYPNNPAHNKAMYVLASMSPDMVEDIINLANTRGRQLLADVANQEDGPPRPLAIFSREYISDGDMPAVWVGFMTTMLAELRTLKGDFDFYESVLKNAFSLPTELAAPMAKKIETYDVLGGSDAAKSKLAWYSKMGMHLQEGIRRTGNWFTRALDINWENDQDQSYDIDYLYELRCLGLAVDELQARARLMKGQAVIASGMGLFHASDGTNPTGDPHGAYGDVYGDADDIATVKLHDTIKPLMGAPLPFNLFGGTKKLFKWGDIVSKLKLKRLLASSGLDKDSGNQVTDPAMRKAVDQVVTTSGNDVVMIDGQNVPLTQVKAGLEALKTCRATGQTGDAYEHVREEYGDAAADNWRRGNVPGLMTNVIEMAGDALATTGDRELDQAIIGDVLNDNEVLYGDVEADTDAEMGGLFTRARINRLIKRGRRRARKLKRQQGRQNRRDAKNDALVAAQDYAHSQNLAAPDPDDPDTGMAPDVQYSNAATDNPDDVFNVDQLDPAMNSAATGNGTALPLDVLYY